MLLGKIIQEIKKKKELKHLDKNFISSRILDYTKQHKINLEKDFSKFSRTSQYRQMFKEIRKQCRLVYGSFQQVKETRSREAYEKIFNEAKGNKVLDIGCGYSPLEYLSIYPEKTYYLCDLDEDAIKKINSFMHNHKIKGKAFLFNPVDQPISKLPKADIVLLLKVLESFEAIKRNITYEILKSLKCKKIIISFSKVALGGKERIKKSGRLWLRKMLDRLNYRYTISDIDKEIFFFIEK